MRILYCIPALANPGGMERIITDKINYLVQNFHIQVFIVTTDQMSRSFFFELDERVKVFNLDLDFDATVALPLPQKYLMVKKKLRIYRRLLNEILVNESIDLCISTGGKELEFLYRMKGSFKKVLEIHFSKNFRKQYLVARNKSFRSELLGDFRNRQLEKQTKNLDAVVVLTKKDEKEWIKTHNNITQIYNFCSFEVGRPAALNMRRAIAVGKLDAQKGFDMLIDAWDLQKENLRDWHLDIFGKGEWEEELKAKIINANLQNHVFLRGVSKDIRKEFDGASMFLFSSRYEGFSLVFIEAMTSGLPIVSFDCPEGPAEMIDDNDIGILVKANDVKSFSQSIKKLAADKYVRERMGLAGFEKAKQFSKVKIMHQWYALFEKLLDKKHRHENLTD